MQLSDKDIKIAMEEGNIVFACPNNAFPFNSTTQIQPASIDLRLGNRFQRIKLQDCDIFDIKNIDKVGNYIESEYYNDGEPILINPQEVIYGQIYEQISISDDISARIEGRSRVARLGISVHCTGNYINPGFSGAMPLQIINHNPFPIYIYPYISICQIVFFRLTDTPLVSYSKRVSKSNAYYNEEYPSPSVIGKDETDDIVKVKTEALIKSWEEQRQRDASIKQNNISQNPTTIQIMNTNDNVNVNVNTIQEQLIVSHIDEFFHDERTYNELLNNIKEIKKQEKLKNEKMISSSDLSDIDEMVKKKNASRFFKLIKKCGKALLDVSKELGCSLLTSIIMLTLQVK